MPDLIHVYHNNQQEGPYSPEQLYDMIAKGTVTPVTLAWKEGISDWVPLNTILSGADGQQATTEPPTAPFAPQPSVSPPPFAATGPKGVGGWLVFFCIGLTILGPLYFLGQFSTSWEQAQPAFAQFPTFKTAILWETAGSIALFIYGFIVGFMIWSGNPNGREIAKKFLLIRLIGFIGIEFVTVALMGDMPAVVVSSVIRATGGAVFGNLIWFLIWWFYFKKSKRVLNTYGGL